MSSFLIQVESLKLAPFVSRSLECVLARFGSSSCGLRWMVCVLGGCGWRAPCLAPLAPLLGSGGESLLISMCVGSLIAETLWLCSKTLLSISLQYQRYSSLTLMGIASWFGCSEAGSEFWEWHCPSAGKPSLARCGSQLAKAYRVQVSSACSSSVPFKDLESEDPAEFVRLQQERCLLAKTVVFGPNQSGDYGHCRCHLFTAIRVAVLLLSQVLIAPVTSISSTLIRRKLEFFTELSFPLLLNSCHPYKTIPPWQNGGCILHCRCKRGCGFEFWHLYSGNRACNVEISPRYKKAIQKLERGPGHPACGL